jgi:hypothetical protein
VDVLIITLINSIDLMVLLLVVRLSVLLVVMAMDMEIPH